MSKILMMSFIFMFKISFAQSNPHKNITISINNRPNEPTICIHAKDSQVMMAATNIDNIYISKDGGLNWSEKKISSKYGVWGDPVIISDTSGAFYFFHLSNPQDGNWIDRIVCQRSDDLGTNWTTGTYMGLNGEKAQDKHWAIVNEKNNDIYVTWTQFDKYGSKSSAHKSSILFSCSNDQGKNWSKPIKINQMDGDCIDSDNTTEGAVPAVGPEGEIYVSWAGPDGLVFDRSLDGGKTWLDKDIKIDPFVGGWDIDIPGIHRSNGMPVTVCDLSQGPNRGTIYVNWADQRNGTDDTDIWMVQSKDKGNTWSEPVKVNNDEGKAHQFLTWMDVDDSNGDIYCVFYDRRALKGEWTNVYLARSTDGGLTFQNHQINDEPFLPEAAIFFGDYNNISVKNGMIRPIWTRLHEGSLSIKTALIDPISLDNETVYTNTETTTEKSEKKLFVSFKLKQKESLSLKILDAKNKCLKTVFKSKKFESGKYILEFTKEDLGLRQGTFNYEIKTKSAILKKGEFTF